MTLHLGIFLLILLGQAVTGIWIFASLSRLSSKNLLLFAGMWSISLIVLSFLPIP